MPLLSSIQPSYIPMAPLTSIAFLCLGGLLLHHSTGPSQGRVGILAAVLSALLSAYGLIELVEHLGIPVFSLEEWLVPDPPVMGAVSTGRMSPATAALLLLSGAIFPMLYLRGRGGGRQKLFGDLAGCLGILVAVGGAVIILSYLHGAPLLYSTATIPMAATTALAFLLLGTGQVLAVGPDAFPSRLFAGPSTRARLLRVFISATIGVVVAIDLLHVYAHRIFFDDTAFISGVSTTAFLVIAGTLIARVALKVGGDMDRSEEVRRGMEETLRNQFHFLQVILDTISTPIFYKDARGFFLGCNKAYEEYIGLPKDHFVGKTVYDIAPKDLADIYHDADDVLLRKGGSQVYETGMVPADGKRHDIIFSRATFTNSDGSIGGLVGTILDITERKQAEETIRQSERKLSLHMQQTMFAVIEWDAEFHVREWNPAATTIFRYTREEAIGRHAAELIIPRNISEDIGKVFNQLLVQFCGSYNTNENVTKDGRIIVCEWFNTPIIDERGTATGAISFAMDITERKKTSAKLARLGMAVDQAAEAIIIADHEGTILYVNPAFERISGYSREEAVGKTPKILRSGIQDKSLYREMWSTLERGEVWTGHLINQRKDGSLYEEDATISPVRDSSGNIVSFVAVMRDVTQLRLLENQVRMAQKMEAVGTLAGGIAHDFNNALTGIFGFGELLRMRMAGDEQALHDLDEILHCGERASTLTRQLLTFARRQVIEPVNLNLSALVADLMKFIGKVVGEHIEVKTSLEKNVPTIHADRGQIEQVIMNLCLNSRDAMPECGRLTVETEEVYLDEEYVSHNPYMKTGRYALLTVSDTGIGMDEKTRDRVFEPFFTTKGPDKGTGLGLAMVYGIVKQHGGFIHLYSEPGKGTAFKVYFPAVEAQPDAVPARRREEIVRGGTETILLAEDEEAIRLYIERALKELGYTVLVARNGEEAIEIFRQHKEIALAVLDVVMPRKGGREAFEEMRKQNPRLKVIFMSGYSANGIHDSFVLIPGTPFLQKPFGPTILARKVREALDTQ